MWRISADTGGTFTDCYALNPAGKQLRCKVLSSGCLRARVIAINEVAIVLSGLHLGNPQLLVGWRCRAVGDCGEGWLVLHAQMGGDGLVLQVEEAVFAVNDLIELRTGEEAPVLGVRLLTGTAPGNACRRVIGL